MLRKSVQAAHPIFVKVSRAVYLATRGVVLGGSGTKGRELAEKLALRQVGAAVLTDKLVNFTEVLGVIARALGSDTNVQNLLRREKVPANSSSQDANSWLCAEGVFGYSV
nr:T-complex protein 11 [Tanacetum cinerariifolium]